MPFNDDLGTQDNRFVVHFWLAPPTGKCDNSRVDTCRTNVFTYCFSPYILLYDKIKSMVYIVHTTKIFSKNTSHIVWWFWRTCVILN